MPSAVSEPARVKLPSINISAIGIIEVGRSGQHERVAVERPADRRGAAGAAGGLGCGDPISVVVVHARACVADLEAVGVHAL